MGIIWDENSIREEMKRLDAKTGLGGAVLPISFGDSRHTLGMFSSRDGGVFRFSKRYFKNPDWPEEMALDVIRHEYAHYMDFVLYGNVGHGLSWKKCCGVVGALPLRCYKDEIADQAKRKHEKEKELTERFDGYQIGKSIKHPTYGIGVIRDITGEALNRRMVVDFQTKGEKELGLAWVDKNCEVLG